MGKAISSAAPIVQTGGLSLLAGGKGKDLLLGKRDPGTAGQHLDLDPSLKRVTDEARAQQSRIIKGFGDLLGSGDQMARNQINLQERFARRGVEDAQRQAQRFVAQRGLGNSSIGLSALMAPQRGLGERLEEIRASLPMLQLSNLSSISGGINAILGAQGAQRAYIPGQASMGRQGGLAPLLGAGIGGMLGGPAGATAGLGIGQAATQLG